MTRSQLASAVGDGSFYVASALFFAHVVGLSAAQLGAALTVSWTIGFLLTTPIGQLGDRVGLRGSAVVLSLLTGLALLLFVLAPSTVVLVVAMSLYAVAQSAASAIRQALLVRLVSPAERVVVRARLQSIVNGGIAFGAGLGGLALYVGATWAYVGVIAIDAVAFGCSALLLLRLPSVAPARANATTRGAVLRDRPYVVAAGLNAVLYLYMPMLSVALPLYIAHSTGAPGWMVAVLFVANTLGVLALQVPAARRVSDLAGAVASVRRAGLLLLAACLAFWAAAAPSSAVLAGLVLLLGIALQVVGEVFLAAGSWEIGFGLADPDRPGQWQGLYGCGVPVARALGPLALAALVLGWSGPGWLVLGAVFVVVSLALSPVVAWGQRRLAADADDHPVSVTGGRVR
ncbi:MFS transporter [Solicola gregarius]|uniref:MFS transporter n=1 Tax=Solicola gregarius TaxID=2908642 RepID=A0AA46TEE7_9ACTN|nr:MFS transporter [Solicola gregarius]UYM03811.1 MFS transporter [Solicola gregarius]